MVLGAAGGGAHLQAGLEAFAVVEGQLQVFGGVVAAVAPGGLLAGKEVFDAAYHAVVPAVGKVVAVAGQGGDVHLVVHQGGVADAGADDLEAGVQEFLGDVPVKPGRQVGAGDAAALYRFQDADRRAR